MDKSTGNIIKWLYEPARGLRKGLMLVQLCRKIGANKQRVRFSSYPLSTIHQEYKTNQLYTFPSVNAPMTLWISYAVSIAGLNTNIILSSESRKPYLSRASPIRLSGSTTSSSLSSATISS